MRRYFATIYVTQDMESSLNAIGECGIVTLTVDAIDGNSAISITTNALRDARFDRQRIFDFGIEEMGAVDTATEGVVSGPEYEEMTRVQRQSVLQRVKKIFGRTSGSN